MSEISPTAILCAFSLDKHILALLNTTLINISWVSIQHY